MSRSRSPSSSPERSKRSRGRRHRSESPDRRKHKRSSRRSDSSDSDRDRRKSKRHKHSKKKSEKDEKPEEETKKPAGIVQEMVKGRTGGVYIPPFKLAQMKKNVDDKSSVEYQRMTWEALRKSINGIVNKVNTANIKNMVPELFQENLVRGRGLLCRSIMKAQMASPGFTHVYVAVVAVINTKLPENGQLLLKRVIVQFRRAYRRRDKVVAIALAKFIAHLVNVQVAHELLALQLLMVLLESPTDDSVEVAVNFVKECGQILQALAPRGINEVFDTFRKILHEGRIDKRVQYTIEGLFADRKNGFKDYPTVLPELDLVESDDQYTFELGLDDELDKEEMLDVFREDPDYEQNEAMWSQIKAQILGESSDEEDDGEDADDEDDDDEDEDEEDEEAAREEEGIQDATEQDLINMRRTIYLTIMSSMSHEECAHKIMRMKMKEGQEMELCTMLIECCSQERTYLRYYGLLGQRFCLINRAYQDSFDESFANQYAMIHRLETNKLRNVAKFFAHLLFTDALPWTVFEYIHLNEEETTSSSRIFIKILVQELSEHLGLISLKDRFSDPYMQQVFGGVFPTDNPRNTRFAINFFTSIGLGGLTDGLRNHLKNAPKMIMAQAEAAEAAQAAAAAQRGSDSSSSSSDSDSSSSSSDSDSSSSSGSDSDSSSSSSSSSSSDSSSDSDSSDSESEEEDRKKKKKKKGGR